MFVLRLCPSYCLRIVVENDSYTCCLQSQKNEIIVKVQFCTLILKCQRCCEFWDTKEVYLYIFRWIEMFINHKICFYTKGYFAVIRLKSKFRQFLNHNLSKLTDLTIWGPNWNNVIWGAVSSIGWQNTEYLFYLFMIYSTMMSVAQIIQHWIFIIK
jgi:hypothetical protein